MKERTEELGSIAREWFQVMRESGDDVRELMHDGCPVACVEDAPFGYAAEPTRFDAIEYQKVLSEEP